MRWRCAFIVRSTAVVTLVAGAVTVRSPIAERVGAVVARCWRRRRCVAAGRRRWAILVRAVVGHARRTALRPALALDDAAERRHALRIEFDVERGQVERLRFDHLDLAAAIAVARHDIDVARTALAAAAAIAIALATAVLALLSIALWLLVAWPWLAAPMRLPLLLALLLLLARWLCMRTRLARLVLCRCLRVAFAVILAPAPAAAATPPTSTALAILAQALTFGLHGVERRVHRFEFVPILVAGTCIGVGRRPGIEIDVVGVRTRRRPVVAVRVQRERWFRLLGVGVASAAATPAAAPPAASPATAMLWIRSVSTRVRVRYSGTDIRGRRRLARRIEVDIVFVIGWQHDGVVVGAIAVGVVAGGRLHPARSQ
jgi:hypothetical protein